MIISRTRKVLILIAVFVILGAAAIFFTDSHRPFSSSRRVSSDKFVVSANDYAKIVSPWLESVATDNSAINISSIREKLLNLHSADQSIGEAHLRLFLGFDSWQRFLANSDEGFRQQALDNFSAAAKFWPDLSVQIEKIQAILQNA